MLSMASLADIAPDGNMCESKNTRLDANPQNEPAMQFQHCSQQDIDAHQLGCARDP